MTDDAFSRSRWLFELQVLGLDAAGPPPRSEPTMTPVDAAYHAVQYALQEAESAPDLRTAIDLGTARQLFMAAVDHERGGNAQGSELSASSSLELSLIALHRSFEIRAGLCQQVALGWLNRRAAGVDARRERDRRMESSDPVAPVPILDDRAPGVSVTLHDDRAFGASVTIH